MELELRRLGIEHYKGYAQRAELELAPFTILVGPNNSGKTALAQAIQLLAGGLAPDEINTSEPLPLEDGFGSKLDKCWKLWNVPAKQELIIRGQGDLQHGIDLIRREV